MLKEHKFLKKSTMIILKGNVLGVLSYKFRLNGTK